MIGYFVTRLFIHEKFYDGVENGVENEVERKDIPEKTSSESIQNQILELIRANPKITKKDMASSIGMSVSGLTRREQEIPHLYRWRDELR